jgi:cell pole-organizing protein PopZ
MPTPTAQQEPTMEEILASIRRIISEDSDPGKPGPVMAAQDGGGEILELTNIVHDDGSIGSASHGPSEPPRMARRPAPAPQPAPMPQRREPEPMQLRDPIPEPRVARRPAPMSAPPVHEPPRHHMRTQSEVKMADNSDREGILSNQASSAVTNAFGMLSRERDVTVGGSGGASLEDMVQQMLKPMLAAWLEQNLPEIVERVVQEEVERASRSGRRR